MASLPKHWRVFAAAFWAPIFGGLLVALVSGALSNWQRERKGPALNSQIEQVSTALNGVKNIADKLEELKAQLKKAAEEKAQVERDFERVAQLRTLTDEQMAAVRASFVHRTIWQVVWDNLLSFTIGVVSSLVASILWLYGYTRRNRSTT